MSILKGELKTKQTDVELVYSSDLDVTVPEAIGNCGWIEPSKATHIAVGADRVVIRALNADQRTLIRDIQGSSQRWLAWCRAGVVSANGSRHRPKITEWIDQLALHGAGALDMLGLAIEAITMGRSLADLQAVLRKLLSDETEVESPADSKSGGE